jgi:hypothetical protein
MNASSKKDDTRLSRRHAVAGAGAVGALAAAAAALPLVQRDAGTSVAAAAPGGETGKTGYQVTQHVLRYYETTRI